MRSTPAAADHLGMIRKLLRSPWGLYGVALALLPLVAIALALRNPQPPGACTGIGWGCSLYEWDLAVFALMIFGIPFVVIAGAVIFVTWVLPERFRPVAVAAGWIAVALPLYALVTVLVSPAS